MNKRTFTRAGFILPAVFVLLAITFYPFIYGMLNSFRRWILYKPQMGRPFVGVAHYRDLLTSPAFSNSLKLTLIFVSISVGCSLLIGLGIALLVGGERLRGKSVFRALLIVPFFVPPVVTGFAFRFMLDTQVGVYGYFLSKLGIHLETILGNPSLAIYAVCLADVWFNAPLAFLILFAALQTVPKDILEAANIDGASAWKQFQCIIFPFLRPALLVVLLIRTMDAFRSFDVIYMMTQGGPGSASETLNLLGFKIGFQFWRMGSASAFSMVLFVIVMVLSMIFVRFLRKK